MAEEQFSAFMTVQSSRVFEASEHKGFSTLLFSYFPINTSSFNDLGSLIIIKFLTAEKKSPLLSIQDLFLIHIILNCLPSILD